jgi:hypothetical protein
MNIELKPRTVSFLVPAPAPANDNAEHRSVPNMPSARRHAVIYKPAKSAMTSGRAGTKRWLLEFEPQSAPFIEPLMGWTGSADPLAQVRLTFPSREAAVAYAKRQGLDYEVREEGKAVQTGHPVDTQAISLWPIEMLHSEWNPLVVSEGGASSSVPNLAA